MIWFLACSTSPWTEATALRPTLDRLDTNADGTVSAAEFAVVAPQTDFGWLDADRNDRLSHDELVAWMDRADPLTFDSRMGRPAISRQQAMASESTSAEIRMLLDLFFFLSEELISADPAIPRPSDHHLRNAAATASLSSPQSTTVLNELREGYEAAGLTFPPGLTP